MFDNLAVDDNNQKEGKEVGSVGQDAQSVNNAVPVLPAPIEDMFSDTDSQEKPAIFQAKNTPASMNHVGEMPPSQVDPYTGEQIKAKNKTIVFALMLISLMLVAILAWYAYRAFFSNMVPELAEPEPEAAFEMTIDDQLVPEEKNSVDLPFNNSSDSIFEQFKDSDGDGLSDSEEMDFGTNYLEVDSDGDGLFDREEIKVYKTDPLDADTDKDGYADGMEVDGGYNPNGDGSLYDMDKQKGLN